MHYTNKQVDIQIIGWGRLQVAACVQQAHMCCTQQVLGKYLTIRKIQCTMYCTCPVQCVQTPEVDFLTADIDNIQHPTIYCNIKFDLRSEQTVGSYTQMLQSLLRVQPEIILYCSVISYIIIYLQKIPFSPYSYILDICRYLHNK